jgi:hypothetical protein
VSDLTEPVEEPEPTADVPEATEPIEHEDPHGELARRNTRLGWLLFCLSLLLFAGVWAVAYIYLALD